MQNIFLLNKSECLQNQKPLKRIKFQHLQDVVAKTPECAVNSVHSNFATAFGLDTKKVQERSRIPPLPAVEKNKI